MWYKYCKKQNTKPAMGYEEKILRSSAELEVRKQLYLKGEYWPTEEIVQSFVNKVIKNLKQRHGSLNNVRREEGQIENLTPVVVKEVSHLIKY